MTSPPEEVTHREFLTLRALEHKLFVVATGPHEMWRPGPEADLRFPRVLGREYATLLDVREYDVGAAGGDRFWKGHIFS